MNLLFEYKNGNYVVKIYDDGTKERIFDLSPIPVYPESMDVKFTDYCNANCKFCHEKSTVNGKHSTENFILNLFSGLPSGIELAIGGGDPLSFPEIKTVLTEFKNRSLICNMTVNGVHIRKNYDRLFNFVNDKHIHGLGISYVTKMHDDCVFGATLTPNTVFHVIMGVHTPDDLKKLVDNVENPKVLLLGYKKHGRGETYYNSTVEHNLYKWNVQLHEFFSKKNLTISFDNLGIKQMDLQRFFTDENWDDFYMGDDGRYTMYIDAVKKEYAVSSTSHDRFNIDNKNIKDMFLHVRQLTNIK